MDDAKLENAETEKDAVPPMQQQQKNGDKKTHHSSTHYPRRSCRQSQQLKPEEAGDASRSSLSSVESFEVVHVRAPRRNGSRKRRRTSRDNGPRLTVRYLRHGMLIASVTLFIIGCLLTVLGFVDANLTPVQRLPMQVIGPACLVATFAVAVLGVVFLRLWRAEMLRQRREIELRTRAQIEMMAADLINKRRSSSVSSRHHQTVLTSSALQNPDMRRQLMLQLRRQSAVDVSAGSRRSSRAAAATRSRHSSVTSALLRQQTNLHQHRKSTDTAISLDSVGPGGRRRYFSGNRSVPGIEISRIDTLDFDDGSLMAQCSGKHGTGGHGASGGKQRFIFINSDGSSGDCSRLSFLGGHGSSEYSLSASRSSRSRSSHDSSCNSRVWDFSSPRESDWDVQGAAGGSTAGGIGTANDLPFGGYQSLLSPGIPRPGGPIVTGRSGSTQVVTFDINQPTARRHSSPASSARRRDSVPAAVGGTTEYQLNRSVTAGTGTNDGYLIRAPRSSPTEFRSTSTSTTATNATEAKNGRDPSGSCSNASHGTRFAGSSEETRSAAGSTPGNAAASAFRRKSCSGEQSLLSVTIDEADTDAENVDEKTTLINHVVGSTSSATTSGTVNDNDVRSIATGGALSERRRAGSLKRNNNVAETAVEAVERRMAKIFDDISYMTIDEALDQHPQQEEQQTTTLTSLEEDSFNGDG